jgi:nicotinamidase-related amidase
MKTALMMIDIQNDYFSKGAMPLSGSKEAGENAKRILERFRADGLPVIHIQHIATRPTATFFQPGTAGAEIHNSVKSHDGETIIIKHYPNSFRETELLACLQATSITDLVICGMMTHMCVDSTVRAAKDFGFNCIVIGDACATKDLEINGELLRAGNVQQSFLAALNYFYAMVKTANQYLESL